MTGLLILLAMLAFLAGAGILAVAKGAIHEIEAFILFLICAVFISGSCIVEAVNLLKKEIASSRGQATDEGVKNPQGEWECPACKVSNPNSIYGCKACGFKLK